MAVCQLCNY